MADGPHNGEFSIIHHGIFDDPKFEEIIPDPVAGWTWVLLLIEAEKAYPSPAAVPFGTDQGALEKLVKAGIVDLLPHHHYVIHGMAAERDRRKARFRAAANAMHQRRKSNADATQSDA